MSSGVGTLGVCDACRNYVTVEKDLVVHQIMSLARRGYDHTLCLSCSQTLLSGWSTLNIINFTIAIMRGASL